jgi:predicted dehydrogenase
MKRRCQPKADPSGIAAVSRRDLLTAGGALGAAAPLVVGRHVLGGEGRQAPSDTLRIAAVGIGGMGQAYLAGCKSERVVALCDLDHNLSARAFQTYPTAARYHDFRKMFDKEAKALDALIIGTPDHLHAILLMAAIRLGKHVYCAKPITHTIGEARKIREALAKAPGLVTMTSVQSSACDAARSTTELLASGVIGPVRELHIWCSHPVYPCSMVRPKETPPPPQGMDWDQWIGPAPYRPYHPVYHPVGWRAWWDFGSGNVADMACHTLHVYFKELQLGAPSVVYACASTRYEGFFKMASTPECESHANVVTWEYPARGSLPPLNVHWYDGGMRPHRPGELDRSLGLPRDGLLFVGEKGKLLAGYYGGNPFRRDGKPRGPEGGLLLPEAKFRDFPNPAKTMPRVEDHYREWTRACKTSSRTSCPVEFGCEMTEVALLGTIALRTGRVLEWDSQAMRITNSSQAHAHVDPPYRTGWSL